MSDAADGELSFFGRLVFRLHVALCKPCEAKHRSFCKTLKVLREMRDVAPIMDEGQHESRSSKG